MLGLPADFSLYDQANKKRSFDFLRQRSIFSLCLSEGLRDSMCINQVRRAESGERKGKDTSEKKARMIREKAPHSFIYIWTRNKTKKEWPSILYSSNSRLWSNSPTPLCLPSPHSCWSLFSRFTRKGKVQDERYEEEIMSRRRKESQVVRWTVVLPRSHCYEWYAWFHIESL